VPTVEGTEEIDVPAGTQSGDELRLKGRGVPKLRGSGRGDLHVIVTVVIPDKLSRSERDLLKQLNEVAAPAMLPKSGGPGLFDRLRDIFN
jgi:molecular chaperone DnaJ